MYDVYGKLVNGIKSVRRRASRGRRGGGEMNPMVLVCLAAMGVFVLTALITYLLALKGEDEVLVPNVVTNEENENLDLLAAIMKLQEKGLNVSVYLKYSSEFKRGVVMEQRPDEGAVVKPGRHVDLTVSQGPVVDKVGNYVGKTLEAVKMEFQHLFTNEENANIKIKDPVVYMNHEAAAGTILFQDPDPGTEIKEGETIYLELYVSKGPGTSQVLVPDYLGQNYTKVLQNFIANKLSFSFKLDESADASKAGLVLEQKPAPGTSIKNTDKIELTMAPPQDIPAGYTFGLYIADLPNFPKLVDMELKEKNGQEETTLYSFQHTGGKISIPYIKKEGSILFFYVNNKLWEGE